MTATMQHQSTLSPTRICVERAVRIALFATTASALISACGGSGDSTEAPLSTDQVRATAGPPPPPRITGAPVDATVGVGGGVRLSVAAIGQGRLTYRWYKNGVAIAGAAGAAANYDINAAVAGDAGVYTVRVTDWNNQTATSSSAKLAVVSQRWAQLGGRVLFSASRHQQPSLALCGSPSVAHILSGNGRDGLYVNFFDGKQWAGGIGGILNVTATGNASDPSLDCVYDGATYRPIVAWSEGTGIANDIYVKSWNGSKWLSVGSGPLNAVAGTSAVRPTLRVTPFDASTGTTFINGATRRSAIAWIENGVPTLKHWDNAWLPYAAGAQIPNATNASDIALTIELDEQGFTYPPVVAWLATSGGSLQQFAATHNQGLGSWVSMGAPVSGVGLPAPLPASLGAGRIGIGVGKYGQGRTPVAFWADAAAPNNFRSYMYDSGNFVQGNGNQAWPRYGTPFTVGNAIKSTSFDPREFRRKGAFGCSSFGNLPSFGLAISHAAGFEVRLGTCGIGTSPADWALLRPSFHVPLEEISLRLKDSGDLDPFVAADPYVAGTWLSAAINGSYELSVWKFYP